MSRLPLEVKEQALKLRSNGYSVKEIADKLGIAKSTSSLWVGHLKLNRRARQRLQKRCLLSYYKASLRWQEKRTEQERQREKIAFNILDKIKKDPNHLKVYCALLYWGEGGKNYKEGIRFVNSDPVLITTFLNLFRKSFNLDENKFRVLVHLHEYHNEEERKNFWSRLTKISKRQFFKVFRKPHTKKRIRKDYPGCVAIYYYDCGIARQLRTIYKVFSKQWGTW